MSTHANMVNKWSKMIITTVCQTERMLAKIQMNVTQSFDTSRAGISLEKFQDHHSSDNNFVAQVGSKKAKIHSTFLATTCIECFKENPKIITKLQKTVL